MKSGWARQLIAFALGLASASGSAADVSPADAQAADDLARRGAGATIFMSHDNDNFTTQRIGAEYLAPYERIEALTGVRLTELHYGRDNWSRDGQQVSVLHRNVEPATAKGWQLEAGLLRQGGHDALTADGFYRTTVFTHTGAELMLSRDVVETINALDRGIYFTLAGASMEQPLTPRLTVVGLGARQEFSDGNHRNHARLKLIFQPNLDLGLTLQMRYRTYTSSDISLAYFNPSHYDESMLALGWRQRTLGWSGSLTVGAGEQHVANDPATSTRLLELAVQNPTNVGYGLRVSGGLNQSASFGGPNYRYSYLQAEWILKL